MTKIYTMTSYVAYYKICKSTSVCSYLQQKLLSHAHSLKTSQKDLPVHLYELATYIATD